MNPSNERPGAQDGKKVAKQLKQRLEDAFGL